MPKGYIYAEIEVINPLEYERWRTVSLGLIADFGGRFLVQRGNPRVLEGDKRVQLVMIVEFESREKAMQWYEAMTTFRREQVLATHVYAVLLTGYDEAEGME
jgi:uncharacterized protein (DUF1330 family)